MAERITSVQNQRVKHAVRLRDRHGRDDQQRIVIDGVREISQAMKAGIQILEVYGCLESLEQREQQVIEDAESAGAHLLDVTPAVMTKLAYGDRASGLVAVARPPRRTLTELSLSDDALVAVLERVEKPGNVGAVVRSADAAGVSAIIVADGGTDLYNPNAIRSSAGAIFSLPVVAATSEETLRWLRDSGFSIYATRVNAETTLWDIRFQRRIAVVLGSEASGLSEVWSASDVQPVGVPQRGVADSLNVSVTAAILFYEAFRQRERSSQ